MDPDWVREIRDQCLDASVAFFFKQWGGVHKHKYARVIDAEAWEEYPDQPLANDRVAAAQKAAQDMYQSAVTQLREWAKRLRQEAADEEARKDAEAKIAKAEKEMLERYRELSHSRPIIIDEPIPAGPPTDEEIEEYNRQFASEIAAAKATAEAKAYWGDMIEWDVGSNRG